MQCGLYLHSFLNLIPVPLPLSLSLNMVFPPGDFYVHFVSKHLLLAVCRWALPVPSCLVAQMGHETSLGSCAVNRGDHASLLD